MKRSFLVLGVVMFAAATTSAVSQTTESPRAAPGASKVKVAASLLDVATEAQIREFFRVSGTEAAQRARTMSLIDANRSIGEPYWPESFWDDIKKTMQTADLVGIVVPIYQRHISKEILSSVNQDLKTMTISEVAATPNGARFCELQQSMEAESNAALLDFTQRELDQVYERHKTEIKAARAKYLATHPDWKD